MNYLGLFEPPGIYGTEPHTGDLLFCHDCEVWWNRWECGLDCWFCGRPFQLVA